MRPELKFKLPAVGSVMNIVVVVFAFVLAGLVVVNPQMLWVVT